MTALKSLYVAVAAATAVIAGAAIAQAPDRACPYGNVAPACGQPGAGPGWGPGPGMGMGPGGGARFASLDTVRNALKLAPEQQAAWDKYVATLDQQREASYRLHEGMRDRMHSGTLSAEDAAKWRETMHAFNTEQFQARTKAREELYAALTPEQKATADRYLRYGGGPGMGPGGGPRGMM